MILAPRRRSRCGRSDCPPQIVNTRTTAHLLTPAVVFAAARRRLIKWVSPPLSQYSESPLTLNLHTSEICRANSPAVLTLVVLLAQVDVAVATGPTMQTVTTSTVLAEGEEGEEGPLGLPMTPFRKLTSKRAWTRLRSSRQWPSLRAPAHQRNSPSRT